MSNLWERLGYIYGHKFSATYGESATNENNELTEAARTWATGLRELTGEQIASGLHECVNCGEAWPPTLPEFVAMCKGKQTNEFGLDYVPEYHRETIRNPERLLSSDARDKHRKEVAAKGMADIRAAMKNKA
jgi:hypothetical protein